MIPKFRFWDKQELNFVPYLHNMTLKHDGTIEGIEYEMPGEGNVYDDISYFEVTQSTGLKDKNGVEIFEGDVVKTKYGEIGYIRWFKGSFDFCDIEGQAFYLFSIGAGQPFEIIGNQFEHPHLLKE